jgi:hypothetical protein
MTKDEFVAAYQRENPRTQYSKAELEGFYDEGHYVINKDTGLLNDVDAGKFGAPKDRADYVRDAEGEPITETIARNKVPAKLEAKAEALAKERSASLERAKRARSERGRNSALEDARGASKNLGEDAAEHFGKRFETDGRKMTKGNGARDFDFTYEGPGSEEAVVLEAKGGESGLGTRFGADGVTRVEQGTKGYVEAVIRDIAVHDEARANRLQEALETGKLKYFVVRQGFTSTGALAPIEIMEFKL